MLAELWHYSILKGKLPILAISDNFNQNEYYVVIPLEKSKKGRTTTFNPNKFDPQEYLKTEVIAGWKCQYGNRKCFLKMEEELNGDNGPKL